MPRRYRISAYDPDHFLSAATPVHSAKGRQLLRVQLYLTLRLENGVLSLRQPYQLPVRGEDLVGEWPQFRYVIRAGALGTRGRASDICSDQRQDWLSRAAKLELEVELRGTGYPVVGKRLLQDEVPEENEPEAVAGSRRSGGRGRLLHWFVTVILCAAFLGLGLSISIVGPTFQDLATNLNRNISSISHIFVGRAFGYLTGSVIGGILFDAINPFLLLGLSLLATTVGLCLVPFCKAVVLLVVMMAIFGVSMGILDTGGNVLILAIWGDAGAPHMQALHFSFALGAFLAPLLAKVALGTPVAAGNHTEGEGNYSSLSRSPEADSESLFGVPDNISFLCAYVIIGTYIFVVCLFLFALFLKKSSQQEKAKASAQRSRRAKYHHTLLCLLFVFFFFYVGAEVTYGSYVFSFAVTHAGMAESEAAGLNSMFWGFFAACRGLAIFFAACLQPGAMIVLSNIGSLVSTLFLVLLSNNAACLWIATSGYGASMATTFPSGISWIEQYTTIHGKSAAFFVVGASLGEMAIPAVVGILQEKYPDLPVVLYTSLGAAVATAVLFPVMYMLATSPLSRQREEHRSEDQRALLPGPGLNDYEEDNEDDDAEKWNEMDFEAIEMNDTMRNSVLETARSILMEPTAEISNQFHSHAFMCEFSTVNMGKSPVDQLQETRTKGTSTERRWIIH
ncbi:LOW QUALITY PROTEIN: sodium-dependent glucose transporter 1 [Artibeus jamaicensis]|uniref:LOW QUALITY PROTEIN: sodium-dependent glucose transporter 1 n=1 Tax=Artibeus jamaicensis TaxID=9417 RepID=UPI00235B0F32|nr:LOW QUALITY PROTEIN: sodium-dependent glucose transporter 1 [Artibeus jamaicensis]